MSRFLRTLLLLGAAVAAVPPAAAFATLSRTGSIGGKYLVGVEHRAIDADPAHGQALRRLYLHHAAGAAANGTGHELFQRDLAG